MDEFEYIVQFIRTKKSENDTQFNRVISRI